MRYSNETVRKVTISLHSMIKTFREEKDYSNMKIHISTGNKKIGRVHNFSIAPIITCANCKECKHFCYDIKACMMYKNVLVARSENTAMVLTNMPETFRKIENYISRKKAHKFFRWHVSGDILNIDYFSHMVEIARKFPEWKFWTYTKNYFIVNKYCEIYGKENIPENFSIMFSVWNGLPCINPYNFPTFTCIQEGMEIPGNEWKCPGNCDVCKKCNRGCINSESTYCFEH